MFEVGNILLICNILYKFVKHKFFLFDNFLDKKKYALPIFFVFFTLKNRSALFFLHFMKILNTYYDDDIWYAIFKFEHCLKF